MKNSKTLKLSVALFFIAALLSLWWWRTHQWRSPSEAVGFTSAKSTPLSSIISASTPRSPISGGQNVDRREKAVQHILGVLTTPIAFYGKVIDQTGRPVADASVNYTALDKFDESGTAYHGQSDSNGDFSISGIRGAALSVGVRKQGYYPILDKSNASFAYGIGPDATRKEPPTKENPAVFILQKQGLTEPLIRAGGGQIDVPRTGQPLNIDLTTGKPGRGELQIETWIGDSCQKRFDWRYKLTIVGGGLVERKGQFDFEAPADGYQPSIEMDMPSAAENWSARPEKEYFAKIPNGRYARFSIQFYAGNRNFVVFTSYLNPEPGHRNLEFDPAKQIKVK
jgi:hypothetical protein